VCALSGNTPLIYSAAVGNDTAIEILIRSFRRLGLNINHQNSDHQTALLVAARNGFLECARLLATDGRADVTIRDPETGRTAEEWARERGCSTQEVLSFAVLSAQVFNVYLRGFRSVFAMKKDSSNSCFSRQGPGMTPESRCAKVFCLVSVDHSNGCVRLRIPSKLAYLPLTCLILHVLIQI
jgi:Ankyrin repeats (3 copies)